MGNLIEKLLPWFDQDKQVKKERQTEAMNVQAQRAVTHSDAVLQSYREAQEVYRKK